MKRDFKVCGFLKDSTYVTAQKYIIIKGVNVKIIFMKILNSYIVASLH